MNAPLRLGALLSALLLVGCSSRPTSFEDEAGPGPDWAFTDLEGVSHSRDTSGGKPALLFFMATWCGSCQATAPRLAAVHEDYGNSTKFYTLSWDPQEDAGDLGRWQERYGQSWPHGVDSGSKIAQAFGVTSQSSIVILDPSGNMVKRWIFAVPTQAAIESALDEAASRA